MAYFPFKTADDAHKVTIDTSNGIVNGAYTTTEALYFSSYRGSGTGYWIGYEYPWGERHTQDENDITDNGLFPYGELLPPGTKFITERTNYGFRQLVFYRPAYVKIPELTSGGGKSRIFKENRPYNAARFLARCAA